MHALEVFLERVFWNGASTLKLYFVLPKSGSKYYFKYTFLDFPVLGILGLGTPLVCTCSLTVIPLRDPHSFRNVPAATFLGANIAFMCHSTEVVLLVCFDVEVEVLLYKVQDQFEYSDTCIVQVSCRFLAYSTCYVLVPMLKSRSVQRVWTSEEATCCSPRLINQSLVGYCKARNTAVIVVVVVEIIECTRVQRGRFLAAIGYVAPIPSHVHLMFTSSPQTQCISRAQPLAP